LKDKLENIAKSILNSFLIEDERESIEMLSDFYSGISNTFIKNESNNEVTLQGGIALSTAHAANCLNDSSRTARFIKGTYFAIKELKKRFPNERVDILYAGCGPYATILLPLLPLFSKDDFSVTFLDINEASVVSVKSILEGLGLMEYVREIIKGDAITYKYDKMLPLHMVITETMYNALTREPQVAITANLAPQLVQNGILIPEAISLDATCTFFVKERYYRNDTNENAIPDKVEKLPLGNLFTLTKENNFLGIMTNNSFQFESEYYQLPKNFSQYPDVCVFTKIKIFDIVELNSAESLITNPICVGSLYNAADSAGFKLVFDFKNIPDWKIKFVVKED
jgi:hypothetical protein